MAATLDGLNPDDLIVRTNVNRPNVAQSFDPLYNSSLSADAIPTLVAALPAMSDADRRVVVTTVLRRWLPPDQPDWRTWNWGRQQAWNVVGETPDALQVLVRSP